jgi:tRNA (cmo5U34)-methyltransferase
VPVELQCAWLPDCGFEDIDCYFKAVELAIFGGLRPSGATTQGS